MTATDYREAPDLFGFSPPTAPDSPRYPNAPGFKGKRGGPSEQAAKRIAPIVTGRKREVLAFLATKAPEPMTADEIARHLQRTPFSIRPRVSELHQMGLVEPVPVRGRNESGLSAWRWRVVPSPEIEQVLS